MQTIGLQCQSVRDTHIHIADRRTQNDISSCSCCFCHSIQKSTGNHTSVTSYFVTIFAAAVDCCCYCSVIWIVVDKAIANSNHNNLSLSLSTSSISVVISSIYIARMSARLLPSLCVFRFCLRIWIIQITILFWPCTHIRQRRKELAKAVECTLIHTPYQPVSTSLAYMCACG